MRSLLPSSTFLAAAATTFVSLGAGCTTRTQVFEGYADDQLWSAMVASAKSPSYDDWKVMDNEVYADEQRRTIEVYRVLKRTYVAPEAPVREEERAWKFQIVLGHDPEALAPAIDFTARQLSVPAHVWREADRYFVQMRLLLSDAGGKPSAPAPSGGETIPE
jgi:hypothetical protein